MVKALKPEVGDYFGFSVALSDTALFVGAPGEGSGGRGVNPDPAKGSMRFSGAGYLFARNDQAWAPSGWFKASNADESDGFGYNVAFTDQAAVVSAIYESSGGNGVNGDQDDNSLTNAGAVYALH